MRLICCDDERHDPASPAGTVVKRGQPAVGWDCWSDGDRCPDCVRRFGYSPRPAELQRAENLARAVLLPYRGEVA
jgi:hypothetical protein